MEAVRLEVSVEARNSGGYTVDIHSENEAFMVSEIVSAISEVGYLVEDCLEKLMPEEGL